MAVKAAKTAQPAASKSGASKGKRAKVELTFDSVQITDTLPPATRELDATSQKLYDLLIQTHQQNKAVSLVVPDAQVTALKSRLNSVAKRANLGVRIRPSDANNGRTKVVFQGKARTLRPRASK